MPQINMHTTPQFEADLALVIAAFGLRNKSQAIRFAVREVAEVFGKLQRPGGGVETGAGSPPEP